MQCIIYCLFEPYTNKVRYIGQTTKKLSVRLDGHISSAKYNRTYIHHWINKCIKENGFIGCVPIQENAIWNEDEIKWIEKFKSDGCDIVNISKGGHGTFGYTVSENTRNKISASLSGRKLSEEIKQKISQNSKGRIVSEYTKKRTSMARSKKIICIETNIIYKSIIEAMIKTNINSGDICSVCKNKLKTAGGFHWRYV